MTEHIEKSVKIMCTDMKPEMIGDALSMAAERIILLDAYDEENADMEKGTNSLIAKHVKQSFDLKYGPTWHCIVGENFGSFLTHEDASYILFTIDNYWVLLFRSA
jgi:dynein light chain LC8-type